MTASVECLCTGPGFCKHVFGGQVINQNQYEACSCTSPLKAFNDKEGCQKRREAWSIRYNGPRENRVVKLEWISTQQLIRDSIYLASLLPTDVTGIVAIPRSGMIVASTIAAHLYLPLYTLGKDSINSVENGRRGRWDKESAQERLLIVDDTAYSGVSMRSARHQINDSRYLYASVYVLPEAAEVVDLFVRKLPSPHLLEWHLLNSSVLGGNASDKVYRAGVACDLDGIIVHDEYSGGQLGSPYLVPRMVPCPLIITGRHESLRSKTEEQLERIGAKYSRLEMYQGEDNSTESLANFKSSVYSKSGCGFLVESSLQQSEIIAGITGMPVICPRAGRVYPSEITLSTLIEDNKNRSGLKSGQRLRHPSSNASAGPITIAPPEGPGTELKDLLVELGIRDEEGCGGCAAMVREMDSWGVEGCELPQNREKILVRLHSQRKKRGWFTTVSVGNIARKQAWFKLMSPVESMIDEAIRRAREKQKPNQLPKTDSEISPVTTVPPAPD